MSAIIGHLDKVKVKYADVVLVHGGGPGCGERSRPDGPSGTASTRSSASPTGTPTDRAAPFRRNDELLSLLPKGVVAFPGSGITDNLVDKARSLGIPVQTRRRLRRALNGSRRSGNTCGAARFSLLSIIAAALALLVLLFARLFPLSRHGGSRSPSLSGVDSPVASFLRIRYR